MEGKNEGGEMEKKKKCEKKCGRNCFEKCEKLFYIRESTRVNP